MEMEHFDQVLNAVFVEIDLGDNFEAVKCAALGGWNEALKVFSRAGENEAAFKLRFTEAGDHNAANDFFLDQDQDEAGKAEEDDNGPREQDIGPFYEKQAENGERHRDGATFQQHPCGLTTRGKDGPIIKTLEFQDQRREWQNE